MADEKKDTKGMLVHDPEVQAMAEMAAILEPLGGEAKARVIRWAMARYGSHAVAIYPITDGD